MGGGGGIIGITMCFFFFLQVQQCRNWADYRELLAGRERRHQGRLEHLWNREVTPLHDPRHPIPHGETTWTSGAQPKCRVWNWVKSWCLILFFIPEELLQKISVTKSTNLLEGASRYEPILLCWKGLGHFNKARLFRLEAAADSVSRRHERWVHLNVEKIALFGLCVNPACLTAVTVCHL